MSVNLPYSLSDHPSLIGIIRMPRCSYLGNSVKIPLIIKDDTGTWKNQTQEVEMATTIIANNLSSEYASIPKNSLTDFYPYTYYVLTDGETEPLILEPQHLPNNINIKGKFACSNQPIERYFIPGYKGDTNGVVYNITNVNQMMLPTATNEGISYLNANANTIMQGRKNQVTGNVLNAIGSVASAIANPMTIGYGATNIINGINSIKEVDSRQKDLMLTPNTISSFGTPSTRYAFDTDNIRLLRYSVSDKVKNKILAYTNRYGNKYNNYATIDIRSYKGFIKFIQPNLDTKLDNIYINKIKSILERGVYCE